MTKRDFFTVLIKVFGLYSLISALFIYLPQNISYFISGMDGEGFAYLIFSLAFVAFLFIVVLKMASKVVTWLGLEKGFDDDRIELSNLKSQDIIKIGCFILGGVLLLDNIPAFINNCIYGFKSDIHGVDIQLVDKFTWITGGVNIILGYLLVTKFALVAKWFDKKSSENT